MLQYSNACNASAIDRTYYFYFIFYSTQSIYHVHKAKSRHVINWVPI